MVSKWCPAEDDVILYVGGQCVALALAVKQFRPDWSMVILWGTHVGVREPGGCCLDIRGWIECPNAREVDVDELKLRKFVDPNVDEHALQIASALLSALAPLE